MPSFIFAALVFVAGLTAAEGLLLFVSGRRHSRRRAVLRLRRHASRIDQDMAAGPSDSILRLSQQPRNWLAQLAGTVARRLSLEILLYRAGITWSTLRFCAVTAVVSTAAFLLGSWAFPMPFALSGIGCALGASLLPFAYVTLAAHRNMQRLEAQLPDAMDLLCRALRAGISLEFGLRSVGEELADPIGHEFRQLADEVSLGLPLRVALEHLMERVSSPDLPFFVTAVLIQRESGGNLAEILDTLAKVVRERLQFGMKVKALLSQMKLTSNVLVLVPFAFGLVISTVSPGYLDPLFKTDIGRVFLYGAIALIGVGWLFCRRMGAVRL